MTINLGFFLIFSKYKETHKTNTFNKQKPKLGEFSIC